MTGLYISEQMRMLYLARHYIYSHRTELYFPPMCIAVHFLWKCWARSISLTSTIVTHPYFLIQSYDGAFLSVVAISIVASLCCCTVQQFGSHGCQWQSASHIFSWKTTSYSVSCQVSVIPLCIQIWSFLLMLWWRYTSYWLTTANNATLNTQSPMLW